jgi:glutathione S-transferase
MLEVYHYPLCPFSRKLRIVLKEKFIGFELFYEPFWERRKEFLRMNPSGSTPVVIKDGKLIIAGNQALFEYIEEAYSDSNLLGNTPEERLVIRRITEWFDVKFYNEVTVYILMEKIIKTVSKTGAPNSQAIQAAKKNILYHLDYIAYLRGDNRYIAGDKPTLADFAAAAQLSVLDFVDDVPWQHNQTTKEWYALVKSRPSFKPLLLDKITNFHPPAHYANPDF